MSTSASNVIDIDSRLEPFFDHYLIDRLNGAQLKLHSPAPQEVAIRFDAPWEGGSSHYATVMPDGDLYRMYYRGSGMSATSEQVYCYATSPDGITWTKPNLGICEVQGSTANNVIWNKYRGHCFMPFRDRRENPQVPASERYKALANGPASGVKHVLALASPDGIHWQEMQSDPVIIQPSMDWGADLAFWDTQQGQYVAYLRGWRTHRGGKPEKLEDWRGADKHVKEGKIFRQMLRYTSQDFIHWSEPEFIDFGDTPLENFYTNAIIPYFRAPHLYLCFPMRFMPTRKLIPEHPAPGVSDGVFITSRDGVNWNRTFMEAYLRPGRDPGNWTDRNNYTVWGILQTAPDELSIYWLEHYRHPTNHIRRGTLRLDGFASLNAGYTGGTATTRPLRFSGDKLLLNYATSAAGSLRVELQDGAGQPLPGYSLEESAELYGDDIAQPAAWQSGTDVSRWAGQPVRLRFALKDADLYSIQFQAYR
ncbi:MAG: hypothetical protein HY326_10110 [Chloroflexi bacterium]|nr:hypothetical protein [Chloroflexota bacterium]